MTIIRYKKSGPGDAAGDAEGRGPAAEQPPKASAPAASRRKRVMRQSPERRLMVRTRLSAIAGVGNPSGSHD